MHRSSMRRIVATALIAVSSATPAHHSQGMFVETPVWVTGVIVRYRPIDPHAMIELQEPQSSGPARKWIVEGPRRGRLERILQNNGGIRDDQLIKVGDRISVCGFPLKKDWDPSRMYADWPPEQGRFVHGRWCDASRYVRLEHRTPRAFIDEVSRGLLASCDDR